MQEESINDILKQILDRLDKIEYTINLNKSTTSTQATCAVCNYSLQDTSGYYCQNSSCPFRSYSISYMRG